jgi:hypothetical protein
LQVLRNLITISRHSFRSWHLQRGNNMANSISIVLQPVIEEKKEREVHRMEVDAAVWLQQQKRKVRVIDEIPGLYNNLNQILQIKNLGGCKIKTLEKRAQPGAYMKHGLLSEGESLSAVIYKDLTALKQAHITHTAVANLMKKVIELKDEWNKSGRVKISLEGQRFTVKVLPEGLQQKDIFSLAANAQQSNREYLIINRGSGKGMKIAEVMIEYIAKFGFFGGSKSPFRIDPITAVEVITGRQFLRCTSLDGLPVYAELEQREVQVGSRCVVS